MDTRMTGFKFFQKTLRLYALDKIALEGLTFFTHFNAHTYILICGSLVGNLVPKNST